MDTPGNGDNQPTHQHPPRPRVRRAFNVHPGMDVYSREGLRLGFIDRMFLEGGRVIGFLVAYGLLARRHKRLPVDKVDHLEDQSIILSIRQHAFHQLPDADPHVV